MTNLTKLSIEATAKMPVTDAAGAEQRNDDGVPMTITFYGPGTKQFQVAKYNFDKRHSANFASLMGKEDKSKTWEDGNNNLAEFLAAVTVSFDGFDYNGLPNNIATYTAAYADITLGHIPEGANVFLGKRSNFKKSLPTASPDSSATPPG